MEGQIISPVGIYEINGQRCKVLCAVIELGTGNNQSVVASASGKIHRVMGWEAQGTTATVPYFYLKSGTGTLISTRLSVPGNGSGLIDRRPIVHSGYCETAAGDALLIDITTAALAMNVFYVTYAPNT